MQEFIARENIRRFEAQLAECDDPGQRDLLMQLLDKERQLLAEAQAIKERRAGAA